MLIHPMNGDNGELEEVVLRARDITAQIEIEEALKRVSLQLITVQEDERRRIAQGLQAAVEDKPHPATGSELDEKQEARWMLELLTQEVLKDSIVTHLSPETVWLLLKKANSNPGR